MQGALRLALLRFTRFCCKPSSPLPRQPQHSLFRAKLAALLVPWTDPVLVLRVEILSSITAFAAFWLAPPLVAPMSGRHRRLPLFRSGSPPPSSSHSRKGSPRVLCSSIISPRAVLPRTSDRARSRRPVFGLFMAILASPLGAISALPPDMSRLAPAKLASASSPANQAGNQAEDKHPRTYRRIRLCPIAIKRGHSRNTPLFQFTRPAWPFAAPAHSRGYRCCFPPLAQPPLRSP